MNSFSHVMLLLLLSAFERRLLADCHGVYDAALLCLARSWVEGQSNRCCAGCLHNS